MSPTHFCNKCGAQNDANAQFCSRCGTSFNPVVAPPATAIPAAVPAAYPAQPYPAAAYSVAGTSYGGFWIRFIAFLIDALIVRVVVSPFGAIFGLGGLAVGGFGPHFGRHGLGLPYFVFGSGAIAVLVLGGSWLYEAFMLSSSYQATLGKMIFGMKVTDLYGNRISFARATGRHFAKWLSGMLLGIGYIMAGFTERKQGLHDMLAGTLVRRY
jgi:uncharacterized RDD family membrane protein YckC